MSDSATGHGFVFVAVFMFTFTTLVSMLPIEFVGVETYDPSSTYPDDWVADEVATWGDVFANWGNMTLERGDLKVDMDISTSPQRKLVFNWYNVEDEIGVRHSFAVLLPLLYAGHWLHKVPSQEGDSFQTLDKTFIMDNIRPNSDPETSRFKLYCPSKDQFVWYFSVSYNETNYSSLSDAWDGGELRIFVGIDWETTTGALNSWYVISTILTFQAPNIHPALNFLIAFPIWAMVGYIAFRLLQALIPSIL